MHGPRLEIHVSPRRFTDEVVHDRLLRVPQSRVADSSGVRGVLFHLSFPSFNRNANPPQMGSGRKPSAAASGSRGAVSFSSARTAKRFPSRCASSDVVKDEQCRLSIHTLRNCLDPRHRFY